MKTLKIKKKKSQSRLNKKKILYFRVSQFTKCFNICTLISEVEK